MRFVSYAQNFEDVMLWRALQHVRGGFYIDVGANDPRKDSVTKAFYERGWHGINIEPVASHHADLERERPLDINLRCAVGARGGTIELWECDTPGLATTDAAVVEQHIRAGRQGAWQRVPVATLAQVCAEHVPRGEIQFLKIDVEGGEEQVLAGADFGRFRPWVVVVEATRPNSREQKHAQWEHLLTGAGYRFAYADGLNRFYVAQEHQELLESLAAPPNIFDAFVVAQQFNVEQEAQQLKETVGRLDAQVRELDQRAVKADQSAALANRKAAQESERAARAEQSAVMAGERCQELQAVVHSLESQFAKATESAALANERALQFSDRATQFSEKAAQAEARIQEWVGRVARTETELQFSQEMVRSTQRLVSQRELQLEQARLLVRQMRESTSWRVTWPLRWVSAKLKGEPPPPPVPRGEVAAPAAVPERAEAGEARPGDAAEAAANADAMQYLPPRAQRLYHEIRRGANEQKEEQ